MHWQAYWDPAHSEGTPCTEPIESVTDGPAKQWQERGGGQKYTRTPREKSLNVIFEDTWAIVKSIFALWIMCPKRRIEKN